MAFTETLTTNRQNWSGDTVTVKVDRQALSWIRFDYEFHLEFLPWPEDVRDILGLGRYAIVGDQWSSPLGYVEAFDTPSRFGALRALIRDSRAWHGKVFFLEIEDIQPICVPHFELVEEEK